MTQKAAALYDAGDDMGAGEAANMAKYAAAEAACDAADRAVQTHGGNGITQEYGMAGLLVATRAGRIAPVSREMILNFVAMHSWGCRSPTDRTSGRSRRGPSWPPPQLAADDTGIARGDVVRRQCRRTASTTGGGRHGSSSRAVVRRHSHRPSGSPCRTPPVTRAAPLGGRAQAGGMLALRQKKFVGSYAVLSRASRVPLRVAVGLAHPDCASSDVKFT